MYVYPYPKADVTVDVVLFAHTTTGLKLLLIQRGREPFAGQWALPGGYIEMDEDLESSARRELREETGLCDVPLTQLGAFGTPGRDPRGRTVSVVYCGVLDAVHGEAVAGDDAAQLGWWPVEHLPLPLAFDHEQIVERALATFVKR